MAVTNQSSLNDGTATYDPWGNVKFADTTGTIPTYGFTGREPDQTDFIYYRARYYDPTIGRFIQRDPIGLRGGTNLYAYANGDPISLNDPDGQAAFYVHAWYAFWTALDRNYGFWDSLRYAWAAAAPDITGFRESLNPSQKYQIPHGAGGMPELGASELSRAQAAGATVLYSVPRLQSPDTSLQGEGIHGFQDIGQHKGEPFIPNGCTGLCALWEGAKHIAKDLFPSTEQRSAIKSNTELAFDIIEGKIGSTPADVGPYTSGGISEKPPK